MRSAKIEFLRRIRLAARTMFKIKLMMNGKRSIMRFSKHACNFWSRATFLVKLQKFAKTGVKILSISLKTTQAWKRFTLTNTPSENWICSWLAQTLGILTCSTQFCRGTSLAALTSFWASESKSIWLLQIERCLTKTTSFRADNSNHSK